MGCLLETFLLYILVVVTPLPEVFRPMGRAGILYGYSYQIFLFKGHCVFYCFIFLHHVVEGAPRHS